MNEEKNDCFSSLPGLYRTEVDSTIAGLIKNEIISRIWSHDGSVWNLGPNKKRETNWLHCPEQMLEKCREIDDFVESVRSQGYTNILLLGMGGAAMTTRVLRAAFGVKKGYPDLTVLDSTDPAAINSTCALNIGKTLFIVSSKSGTTIETVSLFNYFYGRVCQAIGAEHAGQQFIGITDTGSQLVEIAQRLRFRKIFYNDPDIGGRYSALSYYGLVPAALMGLNIDTLMGRAVSMAHACKKPDAYGSDGNPALLLGAALGALAKLGRDKLTFIFPPRLAALGCWLEQLVAESTGKDGKGIVPVVSESPGSPDVYERDRFFVCYHLEDADCNEAEMEPLALSGHPVIHLALNDRYDLGGEFFRWEMAVAIAGSVLEINPFDQPDVNAAKKLCLQLAAEYREKRKLPVETPLLTGQGMEVYYDSDHAANPVANHDVNYPTQNVKEALSRFLDLVQPGDYAALHAYINRTPQHTAALEALGAGIRNSRKIPVLICYGPALLHSTGQLFKGDGGNGLFIRITSDDVNDVDIPDEPGSRSSSITFGVLKAAQALSDGIAMRNCCRREIRIHFNHGIREGIQALANMVQ